MMTNPIDAHPPHLMPLQPDVAAKHLPAMPPGTRPAHPHAEHAAGEPRVALPLSDREFLYAREAVRRAPEVRAERIASLRQRIAAGTYSVPDALLARRILDFKA